MKEKIIKVGIIFFLIIGLGLLVQDTYAKYREHINGTTSADLARWNIIVNDETINNKETLNANIIPVLPGNAYIAPNILAPGATGYYDIVINASETDVSFSYTLLASKDSDCTIADLIITGYEINPGSSANPLTYDTVNGITGTIVYGTSSTTIRIYIEWDDTSADATMDNEADTNAVINNNASATLSNVITFEQIH